MEILRSREVPRVETEYRRIVTPIPAPESLPILEKMRAVEAASMGGQPPILWDRAEGFQIFDRWGNCWIDWTSGVLVTNAGHCHPKVKQAILDQTNHGLLHSFMFPTEVRGKLCAKLAEVAPEGLDKVFLFSTGSEAVECALRFARTYGQKSGGRQKDRVVSFQGAFHGRTLGSQTAGGFPEQKTWIVHPDPNVVHVPFPDGFRCPDTSFELFLQSLAEYGIENGNHSPKESVAAVLCETYQGGNASFAPTEYMQKLRAWCDLNQVLLIFDEVQAGFGRAGTFWAFEHYGVVPDLIATGKGLTGGLPVSAVIGSSEVMDIYPPGAMTVTHTGNPVCNAAALANIEAILEDGLVENAKAMGQILQEELRRIAERFQEHIGAVHGVGMTAALHMVLPGGTEPNQPLAAAIVQGCIERGLMLFAPVGYAGASVKASPPLMITEPALRESIGVLEDAIEAAIEEG